MRQYFEGVVDLIGSRSTQATLSLLGINDPALRAHLQELLSDESPRGSAMLADLVVEALFGWEESKPTMRALAGNLLESALVDAMDMPPRDLRAEYAFKKTWHPYTHQLDAWQKLCAEEDHSLVVTSGTGSGKTECFLVPVLNDLVREYGDRGNQLIGTRALFIYPLNALINSQRDRLRAWTHKFGAGIRFCLYNGNTKEAVPAHEQQRSPNEILSRKLLRDEPPPVLVTNATMLEYMLVRHIDAPILEKSKGILKWIILDEAHTYVGSQAAELALLLRRVMNGFGVDAHNIRFVATSATLGDDESDRALVAYLASIAGISEEQVSVVGGNRAVPQLPDVGENNMSLTELTKIEDDESVSEARYERLAGNAVARRLRASISGGRPQNLSEIVEVLGEKGEEGRGIALRWLDLCSGTSTKSGKTTVPFLPLRGHVFHQVLAGLWCCADRDCECKKGTRLEASWPFGFVYAQRRIRCDCGSPVFELVFCTECNAPHLRAQDVGGRLLQEFEEVRDEFSLLREEEPEFEEADDVDSREFVILAPEPTESSTHGLLVSVADFEIADRADSIEVQRANDPNVCTNCAYTSDRRYTFRSCLLGTPFYVGNTVPSLLEYCDDGSKPSELPCRGRRLITFTDSRQGTARIAAKIQQDAERDRLRGLVYSIVASSGGDEEKVEKLREEIEADRENANTLRERGLESIAKEFDARIKEKEAKIQELTGRIAVPWNDVVTTLASDRDVNVWMLDFYSERNSALFPKSGGARTLAEMLLAREFARRPKRQNSLETLGLVAVDYPGLADRGDPPSKWKSLGLESEDWRAFLKLALDFYVRDNTIVEIPRDWSNWMGAKVFPKTVLAPDSDEPATQVVFKWPLVRKQNLHRLVRILSHATKLDPANPYDEDLINEIMRAMWNTLTSRTGILTPQAGTLQFRLDRSKLAFRAIETAFICPVTNRLLDSTFREVTPYLPQKPGEQSYVCEKVSVPVYSPDVAGMRSETERLASAREWVSSQDSVAELRARNLWTDLSDRIIEGGRYFRAAEHSAQQPASRLQTYESQFKAGKLNVLNCSTTMEMGVDIGGLSMVAMNNVPPHPANYLQRAGRAGRRGETQALTFTICKDNPHERAVFHDPLWPFRTKVPVPYVSMESSRIVQRHVNALLLSYFLRDVISLRETQATRLRSGWFFVAEDKTLAPVDRLMDWLTQMRESGVPVEIVDGLRLVTRSTPFSSVDTQVLIGYTAEGLEELKSDWMPEYELLTKERSEAESLAESDPYRRRVERDLRSLLDQYLLSELATRSFLPGYGFPTGIATFDPYNVNDFIRTRGEPRDDNTARMRDKPGRDLAIALQEYAPGASIVIDGLSYVSAGVSLNRFGASDLRENQVVRIEYRCQRCGYIGNAPSSGFDYRCVDCDEQILTANIRRYLEPTGFAVDFYQSPSNDVTVRQYVPAEEPWVGSAEPLLSLPSPELGVMRSSDSGHIFYHNSGTHGTGFAICLRCGRAEPMTESGDMPKALKSGVPHRKLRGKAGQADEANCDGPDYSYAIAEGVHLGYRDRTDVFEIYLKRPSENQYFHHRRGIDETSKLSWTLAVVLRQALADILGVGAEEMGYAVRASSIPGCDYPVAGIVLFDQCGGGAGFASSAPVHLHRMFVLARQYLACPAACSSACQACLLSHHTRFHIDLLDRHLALEYLDDHFFNLLELGSELRLLGASSRYLPMSAEAAIREFAKVGGERLVVALGGQASDWDLASSRLKHAVLRWRELFQEVELAIAPTTFAELDETTKEDLWVLTRLGAMVTKNPATAIDQGALLAQALSTETSLAIASSQPDASQPDQDFWERDNQVLIASDEMDLLPRGEDVSFELEPRPKTGDQEIEIHDEIDGSLSGFGDRFWNTLLSESQILADRFGGTDHLDSIKYSDRYLYQPWAVLLCVLAFVDLKKRLGNRWHGRTLEISTGDKEPASAGHGFFKDWADTRVRIATMNELFSKYNVTVHVSANPPYEMPHGRLIELTWESGIVTTIRLDQGISFWRAQHVGNAPYLNQRRSPEEQAQQMISSIRNLKVGDQSLPTQIFIKERGMPEK